MTYKAEVSAVLFWSPSFQLLTVIPTTPKTETVKKILAEEMFGGSNSSREDGQETETYLGDQKECGKALC